MRTSSRINRVFYVRIQCDVECYGLHERDYGTFYTSEQTRLQKKPSKIRSRIISLYCEELSRCFYGLCPQVYLFSAGFCCTDAFETFGTFGKFCLRRKLRRTRNRFEHEGSFTVSVNEKTETDRAKINLQKDPGWVEGI